MENLLSVEKIEVVSEKAVVVTLDTGKQYKRNWFKKNGHKAVLISGIDIEYDRNYEVVNQSRRYETKGKEVKAFSSRKKIAAVIPEVEPLKLTPDENASGEVHHEKYNIIKTCLESGIPVYLAGPAGSGKNHTVEQIANELGWNFYFSNSVQQEYKLTGFIDAGGEFHDTEFYKACNDENDCIFFLDEMDASIPEVLVLLNAAIANGYFEFPNGRVNLKHIHFVAAGNTVGSGADELYTGRMVLDQATLDRFAIIEFDYSLNIEMAITKNNADLVRFIHSLRKQANENGIRATFSYRCMTMVTDLEKAGMNMETILSIAVFKGLDKDTINTFNADSYTKYDAALRNIKAA
jgi:hypothetical protein